MLRSQSQRISGVQKEPLSWARTELWWLWNCRLCVRAFHSLLLINHLKGLFLHIRKLTPSDIICHNLLSLFSATELVNSLSVKNTKQKNNPLVVFCKMKLCFIRHLWSIKCGQRGLRAAITAFPNNSLWK